MSESEILAPGMRPRELQCYRARNSMPTSGLDNGRRDYVCKCLPAPRLAALIGKTKMHNTYMARLPNGQFSAARANGRRRDNSDWPSRKIVGPEDR